MFLVGLLALFVAHRAVRARGWVVDSGRRQALSFVFMMAVFACSVLHVEDGMLTWGLRIGWIATLFWPSRRPAVSPEL